MKLKLEKIIAVGALSLSLQPLHSVAGEVGDKDQIQETSEPNFLRLFGSIRARYEFADVDGFDKSYLGSLRTRVGLKTRSFHGLSFLAEGEHTYILTGGDKYRPFPGFAPAHRSVIADPDNFQLNRLQLMYHSDALIVPL